MKQKEYYYNHSYCPNCGSGEYSSTLMCFHFDLNHPENYKDENIIECPCGWKGITHDLVKDK